MVFAIPPGPEKQVRGGNWEENTTSPVSPGAILEEGGGRREEGGEPARPCSPSNRGYRLVLQPPEQTKKVVLVRPMQ